MNKSKIKDWVIKNKKKLLIAGGLTLAVIATAVGVTLVTRKNDEVLEIEANEPMAIEAETVTEEVVV